MLHGEARLTAEVRWHEQLLRELPQLFTNNYPHTPDPAITPPTPPPSSSNQTTQI